MLLTDLQTNAIAQTKKWYNKRDKQCFVIFGYAGSGKTTITEHLIEELDLKNHVAYVTFTGKASLVLSQKGCPATTIHRLIYELENYNENGIPKTRFVKVKKLSSRIKLIVVDEISMVSEEILNDLLSYQVPIIALGDPGQLPPIGKPNHLMQKSDIFLNEIHRQAAENPIIYLSMLAREKREIPVGIYSKDVCVLRRKDLRDASLISADQILCGKNITRQSLNEQIREMVHGGYIDHPIENDKLICLKNNWEITLGEYPLINGMVGYAKKVRRYNSKTDTCSLDFRPEFLPDSSFYRKIKADLSPTKGKSINFEMLDRDDNVFDYGYAITCHKSQGSSFKKLLVFEEVLNYKEHYKWLYTAITRAEQQLIIVKCA